MTDKRPSIYVSDRQAEIDRIRREAEKEEQKDRRLRVRDLTDAEWLSIGEARIS